jgi:hypothetical protein
MMNRTMTKAWKQQAKRHAARWICAATLLIAPAASTLAADDEKVPNARLEGFARNVKVEGATTGTWVLFVVLSVVCMSVLFKNAKRSHMD